jgi:hypothetical protein
MPPVSHHRRPNLSQKRAASALTSLLTGCTDERLSTFTASGLASQYNVPLAEVEAMLANARQGRLL